MKLYTALIIGWLLPSLTPWPVGGVGAANGTATATAEGVISVKDAGAKADGVTDDTAGRANNPGVNLVEADGGKLQVLGYSFGTDEPCIALKQGLQHAILTENNGVRGVEILNGIGERAIITNNEPEAK